MFWLLLTLRYRLILGAFRARGSGGAGAIVTLVLCGGIAVVLLVAASSIARLAERQEDGVTLAQWFLSGLFVNALTFTLAAGRGLHEVFSGSCLRRFPVSRVQLFAARHVVGLLDPVWILYAAAVAGLVAGYAPRLPCAALGAGLAGSLYIAVSYVTARAVVCAIDRLLRHRLGNAVLCGVLLAGFTVAPFLLRTVGSTQSGLFRLAGGVITALPAGVAASVIAGSRMEKLVELLVWCALTLGGLFLLEPSPRLRSVTRMGSGWRLLCDGASAFSDSVWVPLVAKPLLYQLRCDRIRFNCMVTVPMAVLLPVWMGGDGGVAAVYPIQLALFFVAPAMATNIFMLNQFGFDGAGIDRYLLLPVPYGHVLRAGGLASALVGAAVVQSCLLTWLAVEAGGASPGAVWVIGLSGLAGLFFFNAIGLWTSILAPRPVPFRGMAGTQLSWQASLVQGGSIAVALAIAFVVSASPLSGNLSTAWPLAGTAAGLTLVAWLLSLSFTAKLLIHSRHEIRCRIRKP